MPKTRRRQKGTGREVNAQAAGTKGTNITGTDNARLPQNGRTGNRGTITSPTNSLLLSGSMRGPQSLIFPALVMLACWGIAFSFIFLSNEANHYLFGGMAVLLALLWSFSFGLRIRRLRQLRQRSQA